jgi:hypothetical protein
MGWMELCALASGTALWIGANLWWLHYYFVRLAIQIELGEQFWYETRSRMRQASWSEIVRFCVAEPDRPVSGLSIITAMLSDGTRLSMWAQTNDAIGALEVVRNKPWNRDWPGFPLAIGTALSIVILGAIALSVGLIAGYLSLTFDPALAPAGPPMNIRLQLIAGVGGPLLGLASIAFGIYHAVRRPVFYRPGVFRWDERRRRNVLDTVRQLFTSLD